MQNKKTCTRMGRVVAACTAIFMLLSGFAGPAFADGWYKERLKSKQWRAAVPQLKTDGTQVPGGCPIESPAGNFLFTARNPTGVNLDIFVNARSASGEAFDPGAPLPEPVNDPGLKNDFCPTPLPDNTLFFVSARSGGCGSADLVSAVQNPATGWSTPVNLGCDPHGPNTPGLELSPSLIETAWGTFLFFSTDYYSENGKQDIYWSYQKHDGSFSPGIRLPWPINTEYDDRQPNVSQDGREIVFASNRPSSDTDSSGFDIYTAKRRFLFSHWRRVKNLSESVPFDTVDDDETRPSLSWDGKRLYYGSGGVWISERGRGH